MNQDKIKEAFEAWRMKTPNRMMLPKIEWEITSEVWLAACEWLMSQGDSAESEKLAREYIEEDYGANLPCIDFLSDSDYEEINSCMIRAFIEGAKSTRLSCAKEIAEKDARVDELRDCAVRFFDAEDMVAVRTCRKDLLKILEKHELASRKELT